MTKRTGKREDAAAAFSVHLFVFLSKQKKPITNDQLDDA